ncbi:hypothetical protein [Nocardia salmonicida]|uniref:hypothetical protein n=1 Tax=Nocardia salmonicida TaxID=53431 RepID=UPI00340B754A
MRAESCVVVAMFTGGQLADLAILTESNPGAHAAMRELVTDRAPHEVLIVAVAPMRTAPAIWHAAEAFTAALAGTAATTTVYTRSLCETAPVIDLATTNNTTWRG